MLKYIVLGLLGIALTIGLIWIVTTLTVMFIFHKTFDDAVRFIRRTMRD